MSTTDTRAAFEALIANGPLSYLTAQRMDNGEYISKRTRAAWTAYQAATEAAKATGTAGERELPLPKCLGDDVCGLQTFGYTADQMREYGKACAEAARQPAPVALTDDQAWDLIRQTLGYSSSAHGGTLLIEFVEEAGDIYRAILSATNRSQP